MPLRALAAVASFRWFLPADASLHGPALDSHLLLNLWIALALLAVAHGAIFTGLLFRRRERQTSHRFAFEYAPIAGLALLFAFLGVRANRLWAAQRYTGAAPEALQIEATGMQFAWYFRYPGPDAAFSPIDARRIDPAAANPLGLPPATDDVVTSELVLPANRLIDLTLRAQDVIHGFAVPELRLKQNAIPGQTAHVHFTADRPGTYAVLCTQLCGLGHFRMQATLRVVSPADFDRWLRTRESLQ